MLCVCKASCVLLARGLVVEEPLEFVDDVRADVLEGIVLATPTDVLGAADEVGC